MWTVGHSTRSGEEFLEVLRAHGIATLADVRRWPRSRRHPHFDAETLAAALVAAGITYLALPDLGGRRATHAGSINSGLTDPGFRGYADYMQTVAFARELDALVDRPDRDRLALMCAEAVPWRCHRSLLADALLARGVTVEHILDARRSGPHRLSAWARVDGHRVSYPGVLDVDGRPPS
jgi:uncharacterized protein (DUF488 family)